MVHVSFHHLPADERTCMLQAGKGPATCCEDLDTLVKLEGTRSINTGGCFGFSDTSHSINKKSMNRRSIRIGLVPIKA